VSEFDDRLERRMEDLWGEIEERLAAFWDRNERRLAQEMSARGLKGSVFWLLRTLDQIPASEKVHQFRRMNPDIDLSNLSAAPAEKVALGILDMLQAWEE
jgi:hypothetical protein